MTAARGAPGLRARWLVALAAGGVVFLLLAARGHADARALGWDFTWPWRAARFLLDGFDPYVAIRSHGVYPFDSAFKYPLPAVLVALPFARLDPWTAAAAFTAVGITILAFAVTREGWHRLAILASGPVLIGVWTCQWSLLLTGAALLPWIGGLVVAKPTIGLPLFAWRPTWRSAIGAALLVAVALAWQPTWPVEWVRTMLANRSAQYPLPLTVAWVGPVLLLAALRWRTREGRMLLLMSVVPQTLAFYDQLPLLLLPRSKVEVYGATLLSQVGYVAAWVAFQAGHGTRSFNLTAIPYCFATMYVPALLLVMRRSRGETGTRRERPDPLLDTPEKSAVT